MKSYSFFLLFIVEYAAQQTFNIHGSNISGNNFYGSQPLTPATSTASSYQARQYPTKKTTTDGDGDRHNFNFDGTYTGNKFQYSYVKNQYLNRLPKHGLIDAANLEEDSSASVEKVVQRRPNTSVPALRLPPMPPLPPTRQSGATRPPFRRNPDATSSEEYRRENKYIRDTM